MRERYWSHQHFCQKYGESKRGNEESDCRRDGGGVEKYVKFIFLINQY